LERKQPFLELQGLLLFAALSIRPHQMNEVALIILQISVQ